MGNFSSGLTCYMEAGNFIPYMSDPTYYYEESLFLFQIVNMSPFDSKMSCSFGLWYNANFYITIIGFTFEFLLILPLFLDIMKKHSTFRNFYYSLTCIIGICDMIRFFLIGDYGFSPSELLNKTSAHILRHIHIVYSFFMTIFVPICQLTLTLNRLTAVIIPLKHKKVSCQLL